VTVDEQRTTEAQLALDRYVRSMRRPRLVYAGAIAAVVVVIVGLVAFAWSGSEVAHTTLHTAAAPAPSVALQAPSPTLSASWQSTDHAAIGTPYWGGTVITYSTHSVRGRNASTGAIAWSYTRTDRTVCAAIQVQGVTTALFEHGGNCDEATGLDSGTGKRKWTRTFDMDGHPLDGHPAYSVGQYTVMLTTPKVIYAFDPSGGLNRWDFAQTGCSINSAVLGSAGALISQTCVHPKCDGLTFCGSGPQLLLRDGTAGHSDDDKDKANPDQIKWDLIGNPAVPASADQLISALDPSSSKLVVLDVTKGATLHRLDVRSIDTTGVAQFASARAELLWIGGYTYSVELTGAAYFWATPTASPLTVTQAIGELPTSVPDLSHVIVAVASSSGIAVLDAGTGKVSKTYPVQVLPAGASVYPFGSGFLVAGTSSAVYR